MKKIKKFLKPEKKKIVLWPIVFFLTPLLYEFDCNDPTGEDIYYEFYCLSGKVYSPMVLLIYHHIVGYITLYITMPLFYLIFSYIFSSFIVFVHREQKKI